MINSYQKLLSALPLKIFENFSNINFFQALHEDVQKVTSKPRITKEAESAREAWSQYTSRENSQIVDLCVGQLKSSLTCSHCGYVSNVSRKQIFLGLIKYRIF